MLSDGSERRICLAVYSELLVDLALNALVSNFLTVCSLLVNFCLLGTRS